MDIEIKMDQEKIEASRERLECWTNFEEPDRVPVAFEGNPRFCLPKLGLNFAEYFKSPKTMMLAQIMGQKFVIENVGGDNLSFDKGEATMFVNPDFQTVIEAETFGCKILWRDEMIPVIRAPCIKGIEDIEKIEKVDVSRDGLFGKAVEYFKVMKKKASNINIRIGKKTFNPTVSIGGCQGPFTVSAQVRGYSQIMVDIYKNPDLVHALLRAVSDKQIEWLSLCKELRGLPKKGGVGVADDMAANLSLKHYLEFAFPHEEKIYRHFGGQRWFHLCGDINHLLEALVNKLKINTLDSALGWLDLEKLAQLMGGRVLIMGELHPTLFCDGTPEQIVAEAKRAIDVLAPHYGFWLRGEEGARTRMENVLAMVKTAETYGRYPPKALAEGLC